MSEWLITRVLKVMRSEKIVPLLLLAALLLFAGYWLKGQLNIDSCFDLGGVWDHEKNQCRQSEEAQTEASK